MGDIESANQNYTVPAVPVTLLETVGALVDGASVTQGATTDAAWSGTGAASIVAILKKISTDQAAEAASAAALVANDGTSVNVACTAGKTTDTVIKGSAGRCVAAIVTAVGTNDAQIYNNASAGSGALIGVIPQAATLGQRIPIDMPCSLGITVKGNALNGAFAISFS